MRAGEALARYEWATYRTLLIELGFTWKQLRDWFLGNYPDRQLPRSDCIDCP